MSVCQLFADLTPGKAKRKKRGANRKSTEDHFHALEKNLYLSISLFDFSPAPRSLPLSRFLLLPHHSLTFPPRRKEQASPTPPPHFLPSQFFWERELKLHSVAAIVRVIRKSYLQRVRVAGTERAGGRPADGARVCVCLEGREVWLERRFPYLFSSCESI